ncbi:uncharacterized protein BDZ99DRAFT_522984 [Mytilinidion resinicola]|uniref:Uncharacterized protein n=1 Tax=Mytilinidion resinicola TaxID=574789 RepID=A0A6A6YH77_9PEZI|nr:uncharacterized protein BDZ99DRAFT_522984 [Mytilinidion resinicola]KAF2807365.1 hypothetical protein BDZ99DRAFT_522984 [Mytilinidion resinicola]
MGGGHFKIALALIEAGSSIEYGTTVSASDAYYKRRTSTLIEALVRKLLQLEADLNGSMEKSHDYISLGIRETVNVLHVVLPGAWSRSNEENADLITLLIEHVDGHGRHFLQHSTVDFFKDIALARPPHVITKYVLRYAQKAWDGKNKKPRANRSGVFITEEAALVTPWIMFKAIHHAYEAKFFSNA